MSQKMKTARSRPKRPKTFKQEKVTFEVMLRAESEQSVFTEGTVVTAENIEDFRPPRGRNEQVAIRLRSLKFTVRHIGTNSISGEGPPELWEKVFGTKIEKRKQTLSKEHKEAGAIEYWSQIPIRLSKYPLNGKVSWTGLIQFLLQPSWNRLCRRV